MLGRPGGERRELFAQSVPILAAHQVNAGAGSFATFAGDRHAALVIHPWNVCHAWRVCACWVRRHDKDQSTSDRSAAEYQSSLDEYQACVNSNLKNTEACEEKRVQMETNERAYRGR